MCGGRGTGVKLLPQTPKLPPYLTLIKLNHSNNIQDQTNVIHKVNKNNLQKKHKENLQKKKKRKKYVPRIS